MTKTLHKESLKYNTHSLKQPLHFVFATSQNKFFFGWLSLQKKKKSPGE